MASLFHFPTPHRLFLSPYPSLSITNNHHYCLLICRSRPVICASIKKPRSSRKVKSNDDLCNDIREFLSSVGLPEDHVPTMKELSQHGRQDLANIVRRRGYKLVKELLLSSKQPTYESSREDSLVEKSEDESLDGKIIDTGDDDSLPSEASAVDDYINDAINDTTPTDEQNSGDQEPLDYSSAEEKVANFIQYGELDSIEVLDNTWIVYLDDNTWHNKVPELANFIHNGRLDGVEDSGFEIFQRGELVEGAVEGQNVVETESTTPKEHTDLICNGDAAEIFNGNSMAQSTQHVEHPSRQNSPIRHDSSSIEYLTMTEGRTSADTEPYNMEIQAEINHLKFMLHQKELELTQLKQQIEEEKRLLSILQAKAEAEIKEAQRLISEKDAELRAAEDGLSGLKEVEIQYLADGESVEVAGSFNGWHQKIKMDLQESSDLIGEDIQASSDFIDPVGMRKPQLWKTVLWLYPGIYEIKFVVDGHHWTTDPQRESVTRGSIHNNVLRVDG